MTTGDTERIQLGQKSVEEIVDGIVHDFMDQTHTPGVAVSAYLNRQDYLFSFSQPGSGPEITPDTFFGIGSITKVFTSTMLAAQVVAGLKSLQDPVTKYLPDEVASNPCLAEVTLQELATHTSYMLDGAQHLGQPGYNLFNDLPPSSQLVEWWKRWRPADGCEMGKTWAYSNLGFVTLGFAVAGPLTPTEEGQGYNADLQATITGPLQMPNTVSRIPDGSPVAQGHQGPTAKPTNTLAPDLKSTARNMLSWLKANLGAPGITIPAQLRDAMQLAQTVYFKTPPEMQIDMGLGWQIHDKNPNTPPILAKDGGEPEGYTCWIGFIPQQQIALSVLTNEFWGKGCPYSTPDMAMKLMHDLSTFAPAIQTV